MEYLEENALKHSNLLQQVNDAERNKILHEWNHDQFDHSPCKYVHQLFEYQVLQKPENLAILDNNTKLSYSLLNKKANLLGQMLQSLGVKAEVIVGICLLPSAYRVIGLLGILKVGGVYLPLDPDYPNERLEFILEDTNAQILITQKSLLGKFSNFHGKIFLIDALENISEDHHGIKKVELNPENSAYIIYTSGSTGKPKGVLVSHESLAEHSWGISNTYCLQADDRILQFASPAFDVSIEQILPPLIKGGSIVVFDKSQGIKAFFDCVKNSNITVLNLPPVYWRLFIGYLVENKLQFPSKTRLMVVGGDVMRSDDLVLWKKLITNDVKLFNAYGPTETTITSSLLDVTTYIQCNEIKNIVPIGKPLTNRKIYIVNNFGELLPIGVPGEIYIGGGAVAKGYLNRPELTSEKFIPDSFSTVSDMRMYRTGDLACWLPDGNIQFLGRIDNQVKIRGYRVEIEEIECEIRKYPTVKDVVVSTYDDKTGNKSLIAYIQKKGEIFEEKPLSDFLRINLPEFMIPAAYEVVDAFPVSVSGKIDRNALSVFSGTKVYKTITEPTNATEILLVKIWQELLCYEKISVKDSFFDLGGNSLFAIQAQSRIENEFNITLPVNEIFKYPRIVDLAARIDNSIKNGSKNKTKVIDISQEQEEYKFPLSFSQEQMWIIEQTLLTNGTYNVPLLAELSGPLDIQVLKKCLAEIILRHKILRTSYTIFNGIPWQLVSRQFEPSFQINDFSCYQENDKKQAVTQWINENICRSFDFTIGSLVNFYLAKTSEEGFLFLANFHHSIFDEWSVEIFWKELKELYESLINKRGCKLEAIPTQYVDFSLLQRNQMNSGDFDKKIKFWKKQLEGFVETELPTDHPRPAVLKLSGTTITRRLERNIVERLRKFAINENITLNMLFIAIFNILIHRYTQQEDITIGMPISLRNQIEFEKLIGCFLNTLVIRTKFNKEIRFLELLSVVKETLLNTYANNDLPFEKLIEIVNPKRDLSRHPLFQIMFVMANGGSYIDKLNDVNVNILGIKEKNSKFDLTFIVEDSKEHIDLSIEYNSDLFDSDRIERMLGHFQKLLEDALVHPDKKIWELELLTEKEKSQILREWNGTSMDYPKDECIHDLFEKQVERTPDSVAVLFEEQKLTYRELNEKANQFGHYLQKLGVGPETLVGIYIERSLELMVGILGILKAGGTYLPLDPNYPQEKTNEILQEAHVKFLVTQTYFRDKLTNMSEKIIFVDTLLQNIVGKGIKNLGRIAKPNNLAYVIFTSGSTGKPKGVLVTHRNLVHSTTARYYYYSHRIERFLLTSSFTFDSSLAGIFGTLCQGGELHICRQRDINDIFTLIEYIRKNKISNILCIPGLYRALLLAAQNNQLSTLTNVIVAGEECPKELIAQHYDMLPNTQLYNEYGPSEGTVWSTVFHFEPEKSYQKVPIGKPIPNSNVYIVDQYLNLLPIGIPGEIIIGGEGVSKGYLHHPEWTADKFLPDPFSSDLREIYKTGDVGQWQENGDILFLGRLDRQVKIRGYRVEMEEVESKCNEFDPIMTSVGILQENGSGDKQMVMFFTAKVKINPTDLRVFLANKLPDYMIPSQFVQLEELPLLPNGKIDRKALLQLSRRLQRDENFYDINSKVKTNISKRPRSNIEAAMAGIWREVLELDQVGMYDNFFELGGHSLKAVELVIRIERCFGVRLPVSALFQAPTINELSHYVSEKNINLSKNIVKISTEQSQTEPPIFLIHGLTGSVYGLWQLGQLLGKNRVVYGIQASGLLDTKNVEKTIPAMAQSYLEQIRLIQNKGPYLIAGASAGGLICFEIAQKLEMLNEKVDFLGLMDTMGPESMSQSLEIPESQLLYNLLFWRIDLDKDSLEKLSSEELLRTCFNQMMKTKQRIENYKFDDFRRYVEVIKDGREAIISYQPKIIHSRIYLLNSMQENLSNYEEWKRYTDNQVVLLKIKGDHRTIFSPPNVLTLADEINKIIVRK